MNNSILLEVSNEETPDRTPILREREGILVNLIEAIGSLSQTREWSTLKTHVFDGAVENLEKRLASESMKMPLNEKEIYKLQGQILSAKKYSLDALLDTFRLELTNVRKQLNPPTERELAPDTL